jgi:ABC-2 type transport system permease protein
MSTVVKLVAFIGICWKLNFAGALEFRLSFFLTAGMMVLNNLVWIFFWGVYFQRFSIVNGWNLQDIMMMWAVSAGSFGIMATFFGNANRLANMIATGQLDIYLSQPKPVSRMSVSAMGDILFALLIYGGYGNKSWEGMLKFILALLIATLIFLFFIIAVNCLAFFIGNAEGLSFQLFNSILAFSTYPTDIFKGAGRLILFTVVPAGFISYLPIGLLRGIELPFLFTALGVALGLSVGGTWFFYWGLKRYTSGNMMSIRS